MTDPFEEQRDGTTLYGLRSGQIRLLVAPSAGARLVSLVDRTTAREWMWQADPRRSLRTVPAGASFDDSPLIGMDECLPTVAPAVVDGAALPDHGEVWNRSWDLDLAALHERQRIVTAITLETRPLSLQRTIGVEDAVVRFDYELRNLSDAPTTYIWAMHPLLRMRAGDEIVIEGAADTARVDSASGLSDVAADQRVDWRHPAAGADVARLLAGGVDQSLKLYLSTGPAAGFCCRNPEGGSLHGRFGPAEVLPFLGLWISRGGWNGHQHFALEPTNADRDRLDEATGDPAVTLGGGEVRRWFVEWQLGDSDGEQA